MRIGENISVYPDRGYLTIDGKIFKFVEEVKEEKLPVPTEKEFKQLVEYLKPLVAQTVSKKIGSFTYNVQYLWMVCREEYVVEDVTCDQFTKQDKELLLDHNTGEFIGSQLFESQLRKLNNRLDKACAKLAKFAATYGDAAEDAVLAAVFQ